MSDLGVYIHYPWCRKLCPYCDFAVDTGTPRDADYMAAISKELAARRAAFPGRLVSIYLGGGTPSLWQPAMVEHLISHIISHYDVDVRTIEVTLEANPTDVTDENLASWHACHINRLSIGVQSLDPDELVVLGRDHRFGDGRAAVERAQRHGGFTVSADFILGVPPAKRSLPQFLTTTDHLSVYELTIEERTAFGQRAKAGRFHPLDEDTLLELYRSTHERLASDGFEHYEISSYARPGKRAVHNSLYWRGTAYLGLGVGAASLEVRADGSAVRQTNPRKVEAYLADPLTPAERTVVAPAEMRADRLWLGMRTSDGVAEADLPPEITRWLVDEGLGQRRDGNICPTLRGFLMADRIAARIVEAL